MNTALQLQTATGHIKESHWSQKKRVSTLLLDRLILNSAKREGWEVA